jgi:cell division protein FtsQ
VGMPILAVSPEAAAARIEALGMVRDAVVERRLPDTIVVNVTERRPLAIWQRPDGHFALIGTSGAVLTDQDAGAAHAQSPALKLLVGAGAPDHAQDLLDLLAKFPAVDAKVIAAERIDRLRWNLILRDHTVVELPDEHAERALAVLMQADDRIRLLDRPVRTIDLRLADRLVVRPYPKGFIAGTATSDPASAEHKS